MTGLSPEERQAMAKNKDVSATSLQSLTTFGLKMNTRGALTGDVNVRKALAFDSAWPLGDQMVATTSGVVELVNLLRDMPVVGCMAEQHAAWHAPYLWKIPLTQPGPFVDAYAIVDLERRNTPDERALIALSP